MNAILLPSLLLVCAADEKPPEPKLPLGKETSFVTGPLDKHGYVDYEAALCAEYSKNVTPEKNANALFVRAFGPSPEGAEVPPAYFKWLGIAVPPQDGEYFLSLYSFGRDTLRLNEMQLEALLEFRDRAARRVWVPKDCPPLAKWLEANEKPMVLLSEAVKHPDYFNPLVSRRTADESSSLFRVPLPTVQKCRDLGTALSARAMLRLGEKKYDDAWADILACHRLGRLVTRGGVFMETLIGIAICQSACDAALAYLERADLSSERALKRLKELQALPPPAALADKIHLGERMMCLDVLQLVRRRESSRLGLTFESTREPTAEERKALEKIDWVAAMRSVNAWYDRLTAAARIADRAAREKEYDTIDKELRDAKHTIGSPGAFAAVEFLRLVYTKGADKVVQKTVGGMYAALTLPTVRMVQHSLDRFTQAERNLHVAFALAAYHKDSDRYPEKLADLAPQYLAVVPADLFSGKPLLYKPAEKGYLFYSVGSNGKDDDGRGSNDPSGDDLGVRMPLPELKKK